MTARAIMLMGTGSDVGKSLISAGLCRAFVNQGLKVAPFKPQNMSNNAAVTIDGGEIGRAQALQAQAARIAPSVHMNPVLLKPETDRGSQVIVQGRRRETLSARDYFRNRTAYLPAILESFRALTETFDLIIVEGAGSPAEANLRDGDLANMGFAAAANVPALLIGDIHRGGVIASIVGTFAVLDPADRNRLKGFLINNFHGDPDLFSEGVSRIETQINRPSLGVIPHFDAASRLPAEDALALERATRPQGDKFRIMVPRLPRIANFDDLDPLRLEPGVSVEIVPSGQPIAGADLIIIPGSKATVADLAALRSDGWDIDILAHARRGGAILGLCGGYQILGHILRDPLGLEGPAGEVPGLGLLDVETELTPDKTLTRVIAKHATTGEDITAYEIHLGRTSGPDCVRPFAFIGGAPDGAVSANGRVTGTYLHGCFTSDGFRAAFLKQLGAPSSDLAFVSLIDETLDDLARHLEKHVDLKRLLAMAEPVTS
ncbi:MAG: cobyric acid synthase [Rhizobiales bacterium]|nr:cobyric acid synthase [Hyphomicrobiales bacterium]